FPVGRRVKCLRPLITLLPVVSPMALTVPFSLICRSLFWRPPVQCAIALRRLDKLAAPNLPTRFQRPQGGSPLGNSTSMMRRPVSAIKWGTCVSPETSTSTGSKRRTLTGLPLMDTCKPYSRGSPPASAFSGSGSSLPSGILEQAGQFLASFHLLHSSSFV